jgi:3'-phosphoadenosine 5'-phosphosulfate sulfotransferase (PAPS reductase)/FAD synthetase
MKQASDIVVKTYRALSLGAGVQSSVLALLLSQSDPRLVNLGYPKPDVAIFADTGWEPDYVYRHLDWLEEQLQYPLIRVSEGNLKTNLKMGRTASGHHFVDVPLFTVNRDGKKGMLRRQCTNHYKIRPIYRRIRALAGGQRGRPFPKDTRAEMWIGISRDEVARMKPSREPWVKHRWPPVEIGMTRRGCIEWFDSKRVF